MMNLLYSYANGMRRSIQPVWQLRADRLWEIDALRGIAIIMMVIYHLIWDLQGLAGYEINVVTGFWHYFQQATASLFIGLVGLSLTLSYNRALAQGAQSKLWAKYLMRGFQIFSWGLVIGVVTFLYDPPRYVRFGILHLIGLSIILAYPFLRFRWLNLLLGLLLLLLGKIAPWFVVRSGWLDWLTPSAFPRPAYDYFPLIPWFGVVLIGIFLGNLLYRGSPRRRRLFDGTHIGLARGLSFLGQNSLLIYLIHQPLLITSLVLLGIVRL